MTGTHPYVGALLDQLRAEVADRARLTWAAAVEIDPDLAIDPDELDVGIALGWRATIEVLVEHGMLRAPEAP